jgi:hypothetical protein
MGRQEDMHTKVIFDDKPEIGLLQRKSMFFYGTDHFAVKLWLSYVLDISHGYTLEAVYENNVNSGIINTDFGYNE